jgi:hypothetical protein
MAVLTIQTDITSWTWNAFTTSDTYDYFDNSSGRVLLFAKWTNSGAIASGSTATLWVHEIDSTCSVGHTSKKIGLADVSSEPVCLGPLWPYRFNDASTGRVKIEPDYPDGAGAQTGGAAAAGWFFASVKTGVL